MALIEAQNLHKKYSDGTHALRGVDFTIEKGEFVAIMGPSGSGKSTLLHILGFLDRHTEGTYRFQGKEWDDYTQDEIAHTRNSSMGFVFQAFNLLPRTSAIDNVMLPLSYGATPEQKWREEAKQSLDSVGLGHRIEHTSAELSGGERQRVAIARALVTNPDVIFADEPTGNLDTKTGDEIMDIIAGFNRQGKTVVLITHEDHVASFAKRLIFVRDGKIERDEKKS